MATDLRPTTPVTNQTQVLLDPKTSKAIRFFCWMVGTIALLYLLGALVIGLVLGGALVNAISNSGDNTTTTELEVPDLDGDDLPG